MLQFFRRYFLEGFRGNNFEKNSPRGIKRIASSTGQVGLILILLASIGLIFYAMTLNLNKVSNAKNKTMIAAQKASSFMASFMASYAEKYSQEYLGGKIKRCEKTSFFSALFKTILMVIISIIATIWGAPQVAAALWTATAMTAAAAAIDAMYIQPSITSQWNKMMAKLSPNGQIIEYGIQIALGTAVTDQVEFPDLLDWDMDGVFSTYSGSGNTASITDDDKASRYAYYYTKRLQRVRPPDTAPTLEFANQLADFIYFFDEENEEYFDSTSTKVIDFDDDDVWGLHDTVADNPSGHVCDSDPRPSECNPNCVPSAVSCCEYAGCPSGTTCTSTWPNPPDASDPGCCQSCSVPASGAPPDPRCSYDFIANHTNCREFSFMGGVDRADPADNDFPFVYNPYYEDSTNLLYSLREWIGRDDMSPVHQTNPLAPNWHERAHLDPQTHQILKSGITPEPAGANNQGRHDPLNRELVDFEAQDTTGFWQGDPQIGIFPLLYAIQDIGVDLAAADTAGYSGKSCYWKAGECTGVPEDMEYYENPNKKDLRLYALGAPMLGAGPVADDTPIVLESLLPGSGDERVYDLGNGGTPDIVPDPGGLFLADNICGDDTGYGWKRGIDLFCSDPNQPNDTPAVDPNPFNYPYFTECPKHGFDAWTGGIYGTSSCTEDMDDGDFLPRDCFCGEGNANQWSPEYFSKDALDDFYFALPEFMTWANNTIARLINPVSGTFMRASVTEWYFDAADWIEPACTDPNCAVGNPACCPNSYSKKSREGALYSLAAQARNFYNIMNDWIYPTVPHYRGATDTCMGSYYAVWCVPGGASNNNEHGLGECLGVTAEEQATFNVNAADPVPGSTYAGDMEDVVACLDWNVNDQNIFRNGAGALTTVTGMQEKFQACGNDCGPWSCINLARSVVPLVGDYAWIEPMMRSSIQTYWSDKEMYQNCLASLTYEECQDRCTPDNLGGILPTNDSVPVSYTNMNPSSFNTPDMATIASNEAIRASIAADCADAIWDSAGPETIACYDSSGGLLYSVVISDCINTMEVVDGMDNDGNLFVDDMDYNDTITMCNDGLAGSCEAVVKQTFNAAVLQADDPQFYLDILNLTDSVGVSPDEVEDVGGFCRRDDRGSGTADFIEWAQESANEAENIEKKLEQRLRFLRYVLQEGMKARSFFGEATDRFYEFLNNNTDYGVVPALDEDVLAAPLTPNRDDYVFPDLERDVEWNREGERVDIGESTEENVYERYGQDSPAELLTALAYENRGGENGKLPSVDVYVWRDPELKTPRGDTSGGDKFRGYLHAVKVETRALDRCNYGCGEVRWPWIKTKTSKWGTKRCFYLMAYQGRVKTRVIRFDESMDTTNRSFKFPNGVEIWGMKLNHPDVGPGNEAGIFYPGDFSVGIAPSACYQQIDPTILSIGETVAEIPGEERFLHHAFMLNNPPSTSAPASDCTTVPATAGGPAQCYYDTCWKDVHTRLLEKGSHSESCARYLWEGSVMGIRFTECDQDFLNGAN